jgi:hypothetical protein
MKNNNKNIDWFLQLDNESYSDWLSRMLVLRRIEKDLSEMLCKNAYYTMSNQIHFDRFKGKYYLSNIINSLLNMPVVMENDFSIRLGLVLRLEGSADKQYIELFIDYK